MEWKDLYKDISEYLLGTETRKLYQEERKFYREFGDPEKPDAISKLIRNIKKRERMLYFDKFIPPITELLALYFTISKDNPYFLLFFISAETFRWSRHQSNKNYRTEIREFIQEVKFRYRNLDDILY